jgi:chitin synthase
MNAAVVIVADGMHNLSDRMLMLFNVLGLFPDNDLMAYLDGKPVTAHIFECTVQLIFDQNMRMRTTKNDEIVPIQMIFCLKQRNMKKVKFA